MSDILPFPADYMVLGMQLGALPKPPDELPFGDTCVMSGRRITEGYRVMDITTDATNEFLETFRGAATGYVCETVGRAFRQDHNMGSRVIFGDGTHYHPLINIEAAAAAGRPCWSDLVREIGRERIGQNMLAILTTDTKRRLWPRARVGAVGASTPVFLHDSKTCVSQCVTVDWAEMLAALDLVETVYEAGFSKGAIRESLYADTKPLAENGWPTSRAWERTLARWRGQSAMHIATLVAQRRKGETT